MGNNQGPTSLLRTLGLALKKKKSLTPISWAPKILHQQADFIDAYISLSSWSEQRLNATVFWDVPQGKPYHLSFFSLLKLVP